MLDSLLTYLRHALRAVGSVPLTTTTMIACVALGIGPGLAIFGIIDTLLFKSLPVAGADQLVLFARRSSGDVERAFPSPFFDVVTRSSQTLEATAAWYPTKVAARVQGRAEQLSAELVSTNYFETVGVPMARGTDWRENPGDVQGVILSHRYWSTALGSDPSVVGHVVIVQGVPLSVIGVAAREFFGMQVGTMVDLWLPMRYAPMLLRRPDALVSHSQWWTSLVGRRRPAVTIEQAEAEVAGLFTAYRRSVVGQRPTQERLAEIDREPLMLAEGGRGVSRIEGSRARLVLWMSVVSACTLLLVFSNLAAVLIGRLAQRAPELATRLSLGASRRSLLAQLALEHTLVVVAGTAAGTLVWYWMRTVVPQMLFGSTIQLDLSSNWRLVAAASAMALVGILLLTSVAVRWLARRDLMTVLRMGGGTSGPLKWRASQGWSHGVLLLQVAVSVAMVLQAGAFARSLANLSGRDLGFDSAHIVVARLDARNAALTPPALTMLHRQLLQRSRTWPGAESAALARTAPLDSAQEIFDEVRVATGGEPCSVKSVDLQAIEGDYFAVLGLSFVNGGPPSSIAGGAPGLHWRAVVNETFARRCVAAGTVVGLSIASQGGPVWRL